MSASIIPLCFFFFNNPASTEIYTLSLHDALPISQQLITAQPHPVRTITVDNGTEFHAYARLERADRKSTRLNSSHLGISYAVFCLKKKKKKRKKNQIKYQKNHKIKRPNKFSPDHT